MQLDKRLDRKTRHATTTIGIHPRYGESRCRYIKVRLLSDKDGKRYTSSAQSRSGTHFRYTRTYRTSSSSSCDITKAACTNQKGESQLATLFRWLSERSCTDRSFSQGTACSWKLLSRLTAFRDSERQPFLVYTMYMQAVKILGLLALAAVLAVIALVLIKVAPRIESPFSAVITNFEECAAAGNAVMESYPRQCRIEDGRLFVEEISNMPDPNQTSEGITFNGCAVAGCSQQLCVSAEEAPTIVTTCEFRSEYMCYAEASCEPQSDGKCGWTQTAELQRCLADPPSLESETELQAM